MNLPNSVKGIQEKLNYYHSYLGLSQKRPKKAPTKGLPFFMRRIKNMTLIRFVAVNGLNFISCLNT